MIRELFTNHWKAPLLNLVLAWVCGLLAISSFCTCGYMRYSRLTGAVLAIVLGAAFLLVFPATIVSIIHQVRERDWAGLAIALILFALAALADLMWAMGVGMIAYKAMGFGDEYFADGLKMPTYVQVDEPAEIAENWLETGVKSSTSTNRMDSFALYGRSDIWCEAWVNPGEPGQVVLRAYEVTTGKCAFGREVELKSESENAWSVVRTEKFLYYHPHLRVFLRGRENVFYAVRFEVWFKPRSGQPERKLIERVYRVCGHAHCG